MRRIGLQELHQRTGEYVRLVRERGEPIEVTDRGKPVAIISPIGNGERRGESVIDRLTREGRVIPAKGDWRYVEPLPAEPGKPTPSENLATMREDER